MKLRVPFRGALHSPETSLRDHGRTVIAQGTFLASVVGINVMVSRGWGASARGELATVTVLATLAASVGGLGLPDVIVWARQRPGDLNVVPSWYRLSLLLVMFVSGVAGLVALWLFELGFMLAAVIPVIAITTQAVRCEMSGRLARGELALFDRGRLILPGLSLVAIGIGSRLGVGHPAVWITGASMGAYVAARLGNNTRGLKGSVAWPSGEARSVALSSSFGSVFHTSLARIDVLIVAAIAGSAAAGVYAVSLAAGEGVLLAANALAFHALREGAGRQGLSSAIILRSTGSALAVATVVNVTLLGFHAERVLGSGFEDLPTLFLLLTPGLIAMSFSRVQFASDLGAGEGATVVATFGCAVAVQAILDIVLVSWHGAVGAAAACSATYVLIAVAIGTFVRCRPDATLSRPKDDF